jgi:hypothetical protein
MPDMIPKIRMHGWWCVLLLAHGLTAHAVFAADSQSGAPDYSQASTWICRPGADATCTADQDAFPAGDPSLGVPHSKSVGGTLAHIPTCSSQDQTGCIYVWGSYFSGDSSGRQVFGANRKDGLDSACVSPAAPGGGKGVLKLYHRKAPFAPADDPPWVETVGQLSGECRANENGVALRVTVEPGPASSYLDHLLKLPPVPEGWGLHARDIALVQGNMLECSMLRSKRGLTGTDGSRQVFFLPSPPRCLLHSS